jgi:hypothetical protein
VRDNETNVSVNKVRDRNVIKKDAERILKYKSFKNRNTRYVACKKKSDASSNRDNWVHLKIMHEVSEQYTCKVRSQGNRENCHTGHCTYRSSDVGNVITCTINCNYGTAANYVS